MCRILMVAGAEKERTYLGKIAQKYARIPIKIFCDYGQAKKELTTDKYALCIVCLYPEDNAAKELIQYAAGNRTCGVIAAIGENGDKELAQYAKRCGAMVVKIPTTDKHFRQVICDAYTAHQKMTRLIEENRKLAQDLQDMRLVSRAKCLLIQEKRMTEEDAHHYIERQAMDRRVPKRQVAEKILGYYLKER